MQKRKATSWNTRGRGNILYTNGSKYEGINIGFAAFFEDETVCGVLLIDTLVYTE